VRSDIINGFGAGAVGGGGYRHCSSSFVSASIPLSLGRGLYLLMQCQASHRSASASPLARSPSSGFDADNEDSEANARENVVVADGHADVRASTAMIDDPAT